MKKKILLEVDMTFTFYIYKNDKIKIMHLKNNSIYKSGIYILSVFQGIIAAPLGFLDRLVFYLLEHAYADILDCMSVHHGMIY